MIIAARMLFFFLCLQSVAATVVTPALARCPDRPACKGCGCKGGPGYRGPDGRCVGFKQLSKVCGNPPETFCTFENAPGTGLNRDCALGRDKLGSTAGDL
jgi:hypothetical protein